MEKEIKCLRVDAFQNAIDNGCTIWIIIGFISVICGMLLPMVIPLSGFVILCFFFILDMAKLTTGQKLILKRFNSEFFSLYYGGWAFMITFGHAITFDFDINILSLILGFNLHTIIISLSICVGFGDFLLVELMNRKKPSKKPDNTSFYPKFEM